jgi:hypothetical protein
MNGDERPGSGRLAALVRLARRATIDPSWAEVDRGLEVMRARLAGERSRASRVRRAGVLAVALAVGLALLVFAGRRLRDASPPAERAVSVARVVGGALLEGGYVSELGGHGVRLEFSENSRFELTPGTRGRLRAVTPEVVHFIVDHGTASFRITPNPHRRWSVEAGPFVVSVRGTDFTVRWEPTNETLDIELRQGRVAVSGPVVGEELVLRPGQNLSVNLPKRETVISEGGRAEASGTVPPAAPAASETASPAPPPAAVSASATPARQAAGKAAPSWRDALAKGDWGRILAEAERDGIEASLKTRSSEDLFALADAARYRHRPDLARSALLAERERFPSSARALDAVFLLGRVEEMRASGKAAALGWYDEYLGRAPSGTYAAEALGRKLILVKDVEGLASARRIAAEYLVRFPHGSYAEAARSIERAH